MGNQWMALICKLIFFSEGSFFNYIDQMQVVRELKFIYSEKATKFCEMSTSDLTVTKGQLISECLFEKIVWTKIPTIFSKRHSEIN